MQFISYGGVNEYGRSCFLIEISGRRILVDCGISKSAKTVRERYPNFSEADVQRIDAVFITHSHEDHTLALPYAVSLGLNAPVFASAETIAQTRAYFQLWEKTAALEGLPIPYHKEAEEQIDFRPIDMAAAGEWKPLFDEIEYIAGANGHAPGSLWYLFYDRASEESVFFSGDYTMSSAVFPFDWPPATSVDFAVLDGANGVCRSKQADCIADVLSQLDEHVPHNGVLFHVPLAGKSQDWLYLLLSFCKQRDLRMEAEPFLMQELEKLMHEDLFKSGIFRDFSKFLNVQAGIMESGETEPKITLLTDFTLLNGAVRAQGKEAMLTTGPVSPVLKRYVEEENMPLTKLPYHVHPTLTESTALYRHLQPTSFICTHAPKETTEQLEAALRRAAFSSL
ncbi:MBL fold metallo-hydrolase [Salisediminibacterium halotolerans]|uniref:RNA processing exonuclease, beta-lactamase fold, Cft2 family n=1 Tax=Salisediminibacterium halotolerans TaxID=517425 RepID=A0A1H9VJB6_9BACI|nr:MBL fold metallo-hydrolase [Salisediminibacterium haloalkalitolerans]SES21856.1 RNA processing exonuclease, beta-lactamase fold, Cft2 family [Salisediminibacterium haloalkalitolerans]